MARPGDRVVVIAYDGLVPVGVRGRIVEAKPPSTLGGRVLLQMDLTPEEQADASVTWLNEWWVEPDKLRALSAVDALAEVSNG